MTEPPKKSPAAADEFSALAQQALHHAVAWRNRARDSAPRPTASAEQLRQSFDIDLPEQGRDSAAVIAQLVESAAGGLVANTRPNFFAWVMGASHPAGVAADWLVSAWGQNAAIYDAAPAAAVAEDVVARWLLDLLQLPADCSVGFTTGATMASVICLAAARSDLLSRHGYDLERCGVFGAPPVSVFIGEEAHITLFSGLRFLGFGEENLQIIACDRQGRMCSRDLAERLERVKGPALVVCQAGHINSGAFDPIADITALCRRHQAWCHVDGAFGLWARAVPALASLCLGIEDADSWSVDGHKWLQVPYDAGYAIMRNSELHRRTMDASASYLGAAPPEARSPSQYSPELSRRARGFAAWAVLQALGRNGVREMVERHCRCASRLAQQLRRKPGIHVLNEVVLNQVAIAFGPDGPEDTITDRVLETLARQNQFFLEGANWQGYKMLRVSVISRETGPEDIDRLGEAILAAYATVLP